MYASLIVLEMEKTPGLGLSARATNPQSKAIDATLVVDERVEYSRQA